MANTKIPVELSSTPSIVDNGDATAITITSAEKVGIGTTNPSQLLTVESNSFPILQISNTLNNNPTDGVALDLVEKQDGFAASTATFGQTGVYGYRLKLDGSTNKLTLKSGSQTTTNDRVTVERDTGNIGIGTDSPSHKLDVNGDIRLMGSGTDNDSHILYFNNSACAIARDNNDLDLHAYDNMIFGVSNSSYPTSTERMRITSSGNIGVGTTTPTLGKFQVHGSNYVTTNSGKALGGIHVSPSAGAALNEYGGAISFSAGGNGSGAIAAVNTVGSDNDSMGLAFFTHSSSTGSDDAAEAMRIDSTGRLLIGTTETGVVGGLYVKTASQNDNVGVARFQTTGSDLSSCAFAAAKAANNNTTSNVFVRFGINAYNAGSGQINANGSGQCAFGSFSDRRLKENITDLPSQLEKIKALRPREFDYIEEEGGGHQEGFIAQEIEEVYPDLVGERADGMKTLATLGRWEARLIKAIQEQQTIIDDLKSRIEKLEG